MQKYNGQESHMQKGEGTVSFQEKRGILYRLYCHPKVNQRKPVRQVMVPVSLRRQVMELWHNSLMSGHLGVKKTMHCILASFYWPEIEAMSHIFAVCARSARKPYPKVTFQRLRWGGYR